jgi:aminopeptidase N
MVIGVAEFAVSLGGMVDNCIPVTNWVFPENKNEGYNDYESTDDILAFYTKYIGPYPYKKLANVQSKTIFGGMENAGAIFYFENSVNGKHDQETLFAHEIVHQWFGNMATEKSFAHIWLSEGFATYLTHLYIESKYGKDSLEHRMAKDRDDINVFLKSSPRPVVDSTKDLMSLLNDNSYQKGGWVLHMLRRELGDSIFHQSIRNYYQAFAGKNADTRDLQRVFEKTSGKDLQQFFTQWLYRPENPDLKISWQVMADQSIKLNIRQLQKTVFSFPLEIAFVGADGKKINRIYRIDKVENNFVFKPASKMVSLVADPNVSLLFSWTITK